MIRTTILIALAVLLLGFVKFAQAEPAAKSPQGQRKVVLIAGKPSHPPRMHEFNAGVQLLAKCLAQGAPWLKVEISLNGWPKIDGAFGDADAVVFYLDGGARHEAVKEEGARLAKIQKLVDRGVGIGCLHYAVEVEPTQAGADFKRWIGGHYETLFSCNPTWEPTFTNFPDHPVTRGVKLFQIKDEWYFNMRFADGFDSGGPAEAGGMKFQPLLVAAPSDVVRDGPYVYPKGPYSHIQASKGRAEAMMWVVERPDGGRGLGFTGGHYHDNWRNDEFRKIVLNGIVWLAKGEVPATGVVSQVTSDDIEANLDPKPR